MSAGQTADASAHTIRQQALAGRDLTRRYPLPASPTALTHEPGEHGRHSDSYRGRPARLPAPTRLAPAAVLPVTSANRPTVAALLAAFRAGSLTPSAVLASYRAHWATSPTTATAVLAVIDDAEAAARRSDARWAAGTARPLEGIPFGVKDIIDVAGAPVTCGSWQTGDRVASTDAEVVARLKTAGAIPVAMLATSEFAMGAAANARYGLVPNPWDPTRWTGGSSTGSGAGVAAGLVPFALGSDTGGSIRIPAAFCGVAGFKPSYDRLPRTGMASLSWTLDHVGPLGLNATDLRLIFAALDTPAVADPEATPAVPATADPEATPAVPATTDPAATPASAARPLAGIRVGVLGGWHLDCLDAEVAAAFDAARDTLHRLGAQTLPLPTPGYDPALTHVEAWNVFYGEIAATQEAHLPTRELFDAGTNSRLQQGLELPAVDYLRALRRRGPVLETLLAAMDAAQVDLLVLPTVPGAAPELHDMTMTINGVRMNIHDILPRNTRLFDYTGLPALALPMGYSAAGLPLSVQFVGRPWGDVDVLTLGEAFQSVTSFHLRTPRPHVQ